MQVNQFNGFRVMNDQPFLGKKTQTPSTADGAQLRRIIPGDSSVGQSSFGTHLRHFGGPLPPTKMPPSAGPGPLGLPDQVDNLATQVRDYREELGKVHAGLVSQLKSAQDTLKQARQSGDANAITAAQQAIDDLNAQLKANHDSLAAVHGDMQGLRELRQQLIADVKSGNLDAIQQDQNAISQQRDQVLADIQA